MCSTQARKELVSMSAAQLGFLAIGYGLIYYFLARGTVSQVMDVDPEFNGRWRRPCWWVSSRDSTAITHIMLNMNLPKAGYPGSLQWRIWIARVMLWLWPVVIFLMLFLSPH
jgi:hypothetical protein